MAELLNGLKSIIEFLAHVISFPVKIMRLIWFYDVDNLATAMWWLPATAIACVVSMLAIAVIFKVAGREG